MIQYTQKETPVFIPSAIGDLEAIVSRPNAEETPIIGIVCHPHPLYGGTMNNKVVTILVKTFVNLGLWTIRFNFRGVGKSQGKYGNAIGELDDLLSVITWAKAQFPGKKIWLAGFSFGSYIAARAATIEPIDLLITVAPPVNNFDFDSLPNTPLPWIVVQGDQDEVVPAEKVYAWIETRNPPPKLIEMKEATHFFHGRLVELQDRLTKLLK